MFQHSLLNPFEIIGKFLENGHLSIDIGKITYIIENNNEELLIQYDRVFIRILREEKGEFYGEPKFMEFDQ